MKTVFTALAALIFWSYHLHAQPQKGTWMAGGNLYAQYFYSSTNARTAVRMNPSVGYFLTDRLVVGVGLPLSSVTQLPRPGNPYLTLPPPFDPNFEAKKLNNRSVGLAPFVRWYYGEKALRSFFHFGLSYGRISSRLTPVDGSPMTIGYRKWGGALGYGVNYFVSEHVALEALLSLSAGIGDPIDNANGFRLGVEVGVQILLPRRKEAGK